MVEMILESFHTPDGVKNGVLLRRVQPTSLATLVCFTHPDGLHHVENRIEFNDADPFHWRHWIHHDVETFLEGDHEPHLPGDAVPSFAEILLIRRLLDDGDQSLSFTRLDEGSGALQQARLVHDHDRVDLEVDGEVVNRHRVLGHEVLASDWGGIASRHVEDVSELLQGLDEQVVVRARMFLDDTQR